jgi:hypothetical protein
MLAHRGMDRLLPLLDLLETLGSFIFELLGTVHRAAAGSGGFGCLRRRFIIRAFRLVPKLIVDPTF